LISTQVPTKTLMKNFFISMAPLYYSVWKSKFYGAFVLNFASTSTSSTRRLLDSVVVLVPHRSTEPGRPRHRREMT